MRLLFDEGTPVPLRNHLPYHTVETAYERGWHDLKNGELLVRAEAEGFDALSPRTRTSATSRTWRAGGSACSC